MTRENATDALEWGNRLAEALEGLGNAVTAVRYNLPTLTNLQYRELADKADQVHSANLLFEEYLPRLEFYPTAAISILKEHPVIRRNLGDSGDEPAIMADLATRQCSTC